MKLYIICTILLSSLLSFSQVDTAAKKLKFEGDFRFRIEQDWNSLKSDGTSSDDRSRLRYRARAAAYYNHKNSEAGLRIRTGAFNKQQDPQLTLGDSYKEFGTLPIGFEKIYYQYKQKGSTVWVGKNTFPFKKYNELFWSDNVFPEGAFIKQDFKFNQPIFNQLSVSAGHFVIETSGKSFSEDAYFQGFQLTGTFLNSQVNISPTLYLFKNIDNIPDGAETFELNYSIFHVASQIQLRSLPKIKLEADVYYNFEDYSKNDSIPIVFQNQKTGYTLALKYGNLKKANNWLYELTYTNLQKYAALDYMAQNDWARWDYSSYASPDGRLTNLQGVEFVVGYSLTQNLVMKMKYYQVEQLVTTGIVKETNSRVRLDLDINF